MISYFSRSTLQIIRPAWLPHFAREAEADNEKWTTTLAEPPASPSSSGISAAGTGVAWATAMNSSRNCVFGLLIWLALVVSALYKRVSQNHVWMHSLITDLQRFTNILRQDITSNSACLPYGRLGGLSLLTFWCYGLRSRTMAVTLRQIWSCVGYTAAYRSTVFRHKADTEESKSLTLYFPRSSLSLLFVSRVYRFAGIEPVYNYKERSRGNTWLLPKRERDRLQVANGK